ncbi:MAG: hypothetical protein RBU30_21635, partial [Polyangia bacterium]|nr:hypothetical protein [Polyangia bacterium]
MSRPSELRMELSAALIFALGAAACGPSASEGKDGATGSDAAAPDAATTQDGEAPDGAPPDGAASDGAAFDGAIADAGPSDALIPLGDGYCPAVQAPALVPDAPLPPEALPGTFETVQAGGFTDDYVYNSAHELKVGVRREWGGTIIFFGMSGGGPGTNDTNTIDANDTGREVQAAFYDPARAMQNCAWNASCETVATECPFSITYLGWNPVQGGNRCNRGSGVEAVDLTSGVMTVTTRPLFWNPNWDFQTCDSSGCDDSQLWARPSDVRVIQRLRFVRYHVVELDYTLSNLATLDHGSTAQEFPTVYTANGQEGPDLWRLFDSAGTEIAIDTPGNDGFFYENFSSPDGWVTMQRQTLDYGVGMLTESRLTSWQGWQLRTLPFNNFRPIFPFAIPSLGTERGRSYQILGG